MSELTKNPVVIAGAAGLGGLFLGAMLATASLNNKIKQGVRTAFAPAMETLEGQSGGVADLSARLATIEAAVTENATALGTLETSVTGMGSQMQDSFANVSAEIGGQIDEKMAALQTGLGAQLSDAADAQATHIKSALAAMPAAAPVAAMAANGTSDGGGAPVAHDSKLAAAGDAKGVGQTVVLAGGAVRAFVQRIDTDAGAAILSINGDSQKIAAGDSLVVRHAEGTCQVGVSGVSSGGVGIASDCDVPLGSADIGDAFAPGTVAMFSDGKLRVFVSGVVNGDARLAVNGLSTKMVAVGQTLNVSTDAGNCEVKVNGVRGSSVALQGTCG